MVRFMILWKSKLNVKALCLFYFMKVKAKCFWAFKISCFIISIAILIRFDNDSYTISTLLENHEEKQSWKSFFSHIIKIQAQNHLCFD